VKIKFIHFNYNYSHVLIGKAIPILAPCYKNQVPDGTYGPIGIQINKNDF
jgi:hypothetical protein